MARQTRTILKNYFKTGSIPTESQFAELIDTMNTNTGGVGIDTIKDSENGIGGYELNINALVINVSALTGQTYNDPASAATALIALSKGVDSLADGLAVRYKDSQGRVWDYKYVGGNWVLNGDRSFVAIEETLNDEYINSSGELVTSNVVSGTGEADDPYIYEFGTTPFVEVAALEGIYYKGQLNSGVIGVCGYDANMVRLASGYAIVQGTANNQNKEVYIKASSIPAGCKYVRFCAKKAQAHEFRIETDTAAERNSIQIIELRKDVRNLKLMETGGTAGFWDTSSLNPQVESELGDKTKLDDWDWYLIHEDGDSTSIVGKLQKNNIFRFTDGTYAPVVVVASAGDVENPWETIDKGYGLLRAWNHNKFLVDGVGLDGRTTRGIFDEQVTINGITGKLVEMTGICADLPTEYSGVLRCIPFKGIDTSCGHNGAYGTVTAFASGAYPKTNVNQFTNNSKAMAKNTNTSSVDIFAPQMGIQKMSHIVAAELKYGTRDLHNKNMFGGGISSNDTVNASTWGTVAGVRWSLDNKTTWNYGTFGSTPSGFYGDTSQHSTNWSDWLNNYYAKWQTCEHLKVLSYAVENQIGEDSNFQFEGATYYYKTVNGAKSPLEGEFNCKLFKMVNFTMVAYDASANQINVDVEVILQVGVVDGMIYWGDVFDYGWAGFEVVNTHITDSERRMDAYLCTLQHQLDLSTTDNSDEKYPLQATYEHMGRSLITTYGEGYSAQDAPYSLMPMRAGGTLHTGMAAYKWRNKGYNVGNKTYTRLGVRGRCDAYHPCAASRLWYGHYAASLSNQTYASAYQARLIGLISHE